jgi:hypothetical protein
MKRIVAYFRDKQHAEMFVEAIQSWGKREDSRGTDGDARTGP